MDEAREAKLTGQNKAWLLTDSESGKRYQVTSVNQNCTDCLEKMARENNGTVYITLEKITQYYSDEYRCKVSAVSTEGWQDDDAFCLVAAA